MPLLPLVWGWSLFCWFIAAFTSPGPFYLYTEADPLSPNLSTLNIVILDHTRGLILVLLPFPDYFHSTLASSPRFLHLTPRPEMQLPNRPTPPI